MLSENQIMKLESLLESLEKAASQIDDGTIRVSEAQEILKKADANLNEMLEKEIVIVMQIAKQVIVLKVLVKDIVNLNG